MKPIAEQIREFYVPMWIFVCAGLAVGGFMTARGFWGIPSSGNEFMGFDGARAGNGGIWVIFSISFLIGMLRSMSLVRKSLGSSVPDRAKAVLGIIAISGLCLWMSGFMISRGFSGLSDEVGSNTVIWSIFGAAFVGSVWHSVKTLQSELLVTKE